MQYIFCISTGSESEDHTKHNVLFLEAGDLRQDLSWGRTYVYHWLYIATSPQLPLACWATRSGCKRDCSADHSVSREINGHMQYILLNVLDLQQAANNGLRYKDTFVFLHGMLAALTGFMTRHSLRCLLHAID